jgi:2-polyprenyl-6-methoxyphenol hydroxylase-like FAD-dependent oxidoreductase
MLILTPFNGEKEVLMYDAIIIGSGVGGVTSGALLAKHGLNTLIVGCQQTNPKEVSAR